MPRQPERDVRLHEPHGMHSGFGPGGPPPMVQGPPPHPGPPPPGFTNGNGPLNVNGAPNGPPPAIPEAAIAAGIPPPRDVHPALAKLASANEQTWLLLGRVAEQMGDLDRATSSYEHAMRFNPMSISAYTQAAGIHRVKENYPKAIDYFSKALALNNENGEVWSALGHCYLMQDELQKAYAAYQQALYLLPNPKEDPRLWYGIGILYDRYGSLDHAEEAFSSVLRMDKSVFTPDFDKANEILFRLGIIYKQQGKYNSSLEAFERILDKPPSPLAQGDIYFQIGHVYEQQKDLPRAKDAYERVIEENPNHAKVLQQLGWIYHQDGSSFQNQELAINHLTRSLESDPSDSQSWYLLGRAYMSGQKYNKAYEAYQQAVYRDGRNPTFWCSIGVLYFQINQFRDALDAYSRAIRINPYIPEVWFDLGSLYESSNNQIGDAIDAYSRASELEPNNPQIQERLRLLRHAQNTGGVLPAAPQPQDVHPTAYASSTAPPPGPPVHFGGPPSSRLPSDVRDIGPAPPSGHGRMSSPPFGGRAPPPIILDDARANPGHTPFAPMDLDRVPLPPSGRLGGYPPSSGRDGPGGRGPPGVHLHHPVPQPQFTPENLRDAPPPLHSHEPSYASRAPVSRRLSSASPPPPPRGRSPAMYPPPAYGHRNSISSIGPGQSGSSANGPSSHTYGYDSQAAAEREQWERRNHANEQWEREQAERRASTASRHMAYSQASGPYGMSPPPSGRDRSPRSRRDMSPTSPRSPRAASSRSYWDPKHSGGPAPAQVQRTPTLSRPMPPYEPSRRFDPRYDTHPSTEDRDPRYGASPDVPRSSVMPPAHLPARSVSPSGSSHRAPSRSRRRGPVKDQEDEDMPAASRKSRRAPAKRGKDELTASTSGPGGNYRDSPPQGETGGGRGPAGPSALPVRKIDEDYDDPDVVGTLLSLSNQNQSAAPPSAEHLRPTGSSKRALSPAHGQEDPEAKRHRPSEAPTRRPSSGNASSEVRRSPPAASSRPSPIPFRTQATPSQPISPQENGGSGAAPRAPGSVPPQSSPPPPGRNDAPGPRYSQSPRLPSVLPPHPRPLGAGTHGANGNGPPPQAMALPPIATMPQGPPSPSSAGSPPMRKVSPPAQPPSRAAPKLANMMNGPTSNERERDNGSASVTASEQ